MRYNVNDTLICGGPLRRDMATVTYTVAAPVTQDRLTAEIAAESDSMEGVPAPPYADPFGDTSGMADHRNVMNHNSPVWPATTVSGNTVERREYVPAQHFHDTGGEPSKVVEAGALIVDAILDKYPRSAQRPGQAGFVLTKVSEALAFRIGVCEKLAEDVLSAEEGVEIAERSLEAVALDEDDGIDIRAKDGRTWNVKYECNKKTKDGVKRIDISNNEDGTWDMEIEL